MSEPATEERPPGVYVEMTFRPNAALISTVRRLVSDFYTNQIVADADATSRLALATHELLENAVKYGNDDETTVRVMITDEGAERARVTIRTVNRTRPEHLAVLGRCLDELARAPDALRHYQQLLRRTAVDSNSGGSGLGLARIRAEAEMTLRHEVDGEHVAVVAETCIERGQRT